ncbi:MAG: hypothetical protein KatS3mg019_1339 [Fimbriimonadales bacterium]|nr:MAG: hypothetical protein KatS3mg019_1339 [Fimbriimonadales bacterium]
MQGKVYRYIGSETAPLQLWHSVSQSGEAWWFGWSETAMHLPQKLPATLPQEDWERLSIFNEHAELRLLNLSAEPTILMLTEQVQPSPDQWRPCAESYEADSAQHILLGDPPKSAGGATTQLADVAFPRMFDYGVPLQTGKQNTHKVVLKVRYYYDAAHRLRFIRCAELDKHSWRGE